MSSAKSADEGVVIDGCPMHCAKKIAEARRVVPAQHVVVTALRIAKGPSKSYTPDDIEVVVSACWRGVGKCADAPGPGWKD